MGDIEHLSLSHDTSNYYYFSSDSCFYANDDERFTAGIENLNITNRIKTVYILMYKTLANNSILSFVDFYNKKGFTVRFYLRSRESIVFTNDEDYIEVINTYANTFLIKDSIYYVWDEEFD